jgi:hypothetical protein
MTMAPINEMFSESVPLYLTEEFIDIPVMLSHSSDKVVELLDKIVDLPATG